MIKLSDKKNYKKITIVTIFAIAMAFLEAVVVIYLRKIYYPNGFNFPLIIVEPSILTIEWVREFFTIIILACVGILAGKKLYEKLAYFLYSFAIWDIFYYVWLKLALNWPSSFLTWDLLFLIPLPWVGPVLAPIICSFTMLIFSFCIIHLQNKKKRIKIGFKELILLIFGSLLIVYTFLYDYSRLIIQHGFLSDFFNLTENQEFLLIVAGYVPVNYKWLIFIIGEILIVSAILLFYIKNKKEER